jgi:zinc protease
VLVVVGDVDTDEALRRAEESYGGWSNGRVVINEPPSEPAQPELRFRAYEGPMDHAYLGAGFHVPSILHADYPALQMLAELASSGRSSRFYQRVREEKRLVTSAGADLLAEKWPGFFLLAASMPPAKWETACGALLEEIERFKQDLVSDSELDKARRQVERSMYRELETMEGQASNIGYYQLLGDFRLADLHREAIQRVRADEIMEVARRYFHPSNLSVIGYVPKSFGLETLAYERVLGVVEGALSSTGGVTEMPQAPPAASASATASSTRASRASDVDESGVSMFTLDNGVRVLLKQRPNVPLVSMLTVFPGGGRFEPEGRSGLGTLTHRVLTKGGARFNAEEIAEKIEGLGGSIDSFSSFDTGGVSVGVLSEFAEEAVEIYRDVLREPKFDVGRVEQEKTRLLEELARRYDNPVPFAMDHMFRALFGTHPYAYPFLGDATEVGALAARDCTEWYHSLLTPKQTVLAIVGDLSNERAHRIAERLLGDLGANTPAHPRADAPAIPDAPGEHLLRRAGIKQAVTFVGFPAPRMETPESIALEVTNAVLTGLGGRLFVELRDKRSLGYMTGSAYNALYRGGIFLGYANPGAEGIDEAVRVILHELDLISREPVSDEELSRAKAWLAGSHVMELQRNGAQAVGYGTYEALGFGWPALDRFPDEIRAVAKDDIMAVSRAVFRRENAVIVRMRPE